MFVDPIVVILVLVPIFVPVVNNVGLDPVLVGTVITIQVAIGSATPPFLAVIFYGNCNFQKTIYRSCKRNTTFYYHALKRGSCCNIFPQIALFLRDLAFR